MQNESGGNTTGGGTASDGADHFMCGDFFMLLLPFAGDYVVEAHDWYAVTELHDLIGSPLPQLSTCQTFQVEASPTADSEL